MDSFNTFLRKISEDDVMTILLIAIAVTIASHIPQLLKGGNRVISDKNNFWTAPTIGLHVFVGILLIYALILYMKK